MDKLNLAILCQSVNLFSRVERSERIGFVSLFFATQPVERKSKRKPNSAEYLGIVAEIEPYEGADNKPKERRQRG
jgi:hypothetical protein